MANISRLLSCAQPTWSLFTSELKLRALMNLGLLFNESIFITDSQVADNPHFFKSFLTKGTDPAGAFGALATYVESGYLKLLLRDESYLTRKHQFIECNSLLDVYAGWLRQDLPGAWVVQDQTANRRKYVSALDELIKDDSIIRYSYRTVKSLFARRIRSSISPETASPLQELVNELPDATRREYLAILRRPYFTHSDLYDFITRHGQARSKLAIVQGLIDEASYAEVTNVGLVGPDTTSGYVVSTIWRTEAPSPIPVGPPEAFADRVWHVPSIRLLGLLSPVEVLALRDKARPLFEIHELSADAPESEAARLRDTYIDRLERYWYAICDAVASRHPEAATAPVRAIVSAGHRWRNAPLWFRRIPSIVLDIPVLLPWKGVRKAVDLVKDKLSLRIVLSGESPELANLRQLLPRSSWMSASSLIGQTEGKLAPPTTEHRQLPAPKSSATTMQHQRPRVRFPEVNCG